METLSIRESVDSIKVRIKNSNGNSIAVERQTGKSTALAEIACDQYRGKAFIFCINARMAELFLDRYREMLPHANEPKCVSRIDQVRGHDDPILVDEWFHLSESVRRELLLTGRVVAAVGSLPW